MYECFFFAKKCALTRNFKQEAITTYFANIDQMALGHAFLLQEFGPEFGRPRIGWVRFFVFFL